MIISMTGEPAVATKSEQACLSDGLPAPADSVGGARRSHNYEYGAPYLLSGDLLITAELS